MAAIFCVVNVLHSEVLTRNTVQARLRIQFADHVISGNFSRKPEAQPSTVFVLLLRLSGKRTCEVCHCCDRPSACWSIATYAAADPRQYITSHAQLDTLKQGCCQLCPGGARGSPCPGCPSSCFLWQNSIITAGFSDWLNKMIPQLTRIDKRLAYTLHSQANC